MGNLKVAYIFHLAFLFFGLVGVGIILVGTSKYGVGISPDSIHYIFAARSILSDHSILAFGGSPLIAWPPLYPASLAGLGLMGIEPLTGARYMNAAVFGLTVFSSGLLFRNYIRSWPLVILGIVLMLISWALFRVSIMAWTESLFLLLTIWFVIYLSKFLTNQRLVFLLTITVLAALALMQRYIGITLVLSGVISIVLIYGKSVRYRFGCVAFFGAVSTIPVTMWLARNYWLTSSLTGGRTSSSTSLSDNVGQVLGVLSSWIVPVQYLPPTPPTAILMALSLAALAGLVGLAFKARLGRFAKRQEISLAPPAIFVVVYTLFLITATTIIAFTQIDDRYMSTIYVFVVLFCLLGVEQLATGALTHILPSWLVLGRMLVFVGLIFNEWTVSKLIDFGMISLEYPLANGFITQPDYDIQTPFRVMILTFNLAFVGFGALIIVFRQKPWILRLFITGILAVWLMYPLAQIYFSVSNKAASGSGGYNSTIWRESPLIDHIRNNPLEGSVYSNKDNVLYILTYGTGTSSPLNIALIRDNAPITQSEIPRVNTSANLRRPRSRVNKQPVDNDKYLVWISVKPFETSLDYSQMSSKFSFIEAAKFPDGAIYLLR